MPRTVRYPFDVTCSLTTGCASLLDFPLSGRAPTDMHTHLDQVATVAIGGGSDGFLCSLRTVDGATPGSIFIQANVPVGGTDGTGTSTLVIDGAATTVRIYIFTVAVTAGSPTHFSGYADVTYGDLSELPAAPAIADLADTPTKLYIVAQDSTAWVWTGGTRTQLFIDADSRSAAQGMQAVATAGEAAFFVDWDSQLWQTGDIWRADEVTGEPRFVQQAWLSKIDGAQPTLLMGPHGIGPAYMNDTALWVQGTRQLMGLGIHREGSLMNGLVPSSPDPIDHPQQGAYTWDAGGVDPPAEARVTFDYRNYTWKSLAESSAAAYAQFAAKVSASKPYGQMVG